MYSPFNFSFRNNKQPTRSYHVGIDNFSMDSKPATFVPASSGFASSFFVPRRKQTLTPNPSNMIHLESHRILEEEQLRNFQMNSQKNFYDFSYMPSSNCHNNKHMTNNYPLNATYSNESNQPNKFQPAEHCHISHKSLFENIKEFEQQSGTVFFPKQIVSQLYKNCQRLSSVCNQDSAGDYEFTGRWKGKRKQNVANTHHGRKLQQKNYHERSRSKHEQNANEDSKEQMTIKARDKISDHHSPSVRAKTDETKELSVQPFFIYSEVDFPEIKKTLVKPTKSRRRRNNYDVNRKSKKQDCLERSDKYVVIAREAAATTPTFEPPKRSLCDRIINSPKKILPCSQSLLFPKKPILKLSKARRSFSESSDDWIEFIPEENMRSSVNNENCDSETSDEEEYDYDESSCSDSDELDDDQNDQKDSGLERKKVS